MDIQSTAIMQGAAGRPLKGPNVDDVFNFTVFRGDDGQNQTVTTGIDLQNEGGMVYCKTYYGSNDGFICDTERGLGKFLSPEGSYTTLNKTVADTISAFGTTGHTVGGNEPFGKSTKQGHFTFRKCPGFFDIVTYTGNGSARTIAHSLGSVPGMIWVKNLSTNYDWSLYHRKMHDTNPEQYYQRLNTTDARYDDSTFWNDTAPTSTHFSLGTADNVNENGDSFVAYLFAHDDQSFGPNGDSAIIKCGSFTSDGNGKVDPGVDLGWEPQLLMWRKQVNAANTYVTHTTNKWNRNGDMFAMEMDTNVGWVDKMTENSDGGCFPTPTGFISPNSSVFDASNTFWYMAIRRNEPSVQEPPDGPKQVFAVDTGSGSSDGPNFDASFAVDAYLDKVQVDADDDVFMNARILGAKRSRIDTDGQFSSSNSVEWFFSNGVGDNSMFGSDDIAWMWKRAPEFLDIVHYKGNATNDTWRNHQLGVKPEMMWIKAVDWSWGSWMVWHKHFQGGSDTLNLQSKGAKSASGSTFGTSPVSASQFRVGTDNHTNNSSYDYIALLWASCPGVSSIGTYTGNENSTGPSVSCGFQPTFIMLKNIDDNNNYSHWYIYDTVRGLGSGNDKRIPLNIGDQQYSADHISLNSDGFQIVSDDVRPNADGKTYIYWALA